MTFHVGYYPSMYIAFIYNSETDEVTEVPLFFTYALVYHIAGLNYIKSKIKGKLGCLAIVEDSSYEKNKNYIKEGIEAGFEKAEIISQEKALYLHATFYSDYVPKKNHVIWIIHKGVNGAIQKNRVCIWQKLNDTAKHCGTYLMETDFIAMSTNPKCFYPDVVLYEPNTYKVTEEIISKCTNVRFYPFQTVPVSSIAIWHYPPEGQKFLYTTFKGPLLYARLMANDLKLIEFQTENVLKDTWAINVRNRNAWFFDGGTKVADIESNSKLPSKYLIKLRNVENDMEIIVTKSLGSKDDSTSTRKVDESNLSSNNHTDTIANKKGVDALKPNVHQTQEKPNDYLELVENVVNIAAKNPNIVEDVKQIANQFDYTLSQTIDRISLPPSDHLFLILSIDKCGIVEFEFTNMFPEYFPSIDEFINTFYFEKNSNSQYQKIVECTISETNAQIYDFPKRITANDNSVTAIGIDLGTSRCCAAVNRKDGVQTVALENLGERLLPSFVAFDENFEKCGQVVIDRLVYFANSTVFDVKRFIGKKFEDIKVDSNWTFKIGEDNGKAKIQVQSKNGTISKYPVEISAALLKHMKKKSEEFQGCEMSDVVITVPAAFDASQKEATRVAALLAGWKTIHLLPEPVAAAFAYFIDRPIPNDTTLLLLDLGGGTLDVCIFKIANKKIQIIGKRGHSNLGGRDFDNLLIDHFKQEIKKRHGLNIPISKQYKLMTECQKIKHNLTVRKEDHFDIEDFFPSIEDENIVEIDRDEFETMSKNLLEKIEANINFALNENKLKSDQINKLLYVGGGCRMPMIRKLCSTIFPNAIHLCEEHPDEVVAIGAAYFAYYLKAKNTETCSIM